MPGFDGTGPLGQEPTPTPPRRGRGTGGGRGFCRPVRGQEAYDTPVVYGVGRGGLPRGGGRGFTFGGRRGRGRRRGRACHPFASAPEMNKEQELGWLKEQSQWMQERLNQITQRISEIAADEQNQ